MQRTLQAKLGDYTAVIRLRRYDSRVDEGLWYGAELSPPKEVVQRCEVRYRGRRIPIGRGAYCDLSEINSVYFYKNRRGEMVLKIEGGDAAGSYRAYLVFSRGALVRRRVESGEFPNNFYEETRYVNIPIKED
jgi:hypothetical protein